MSKNLINTANRLLTASMLLVALIACQQIPQDQTSSHFSIPQNQKLMTKSN